VWHFLAHRRRPGSAFHRGNALVIASLPIVVPGGTGNAWANPQPAETPHRLVLGGGFVVDGGRDRRLQEHAAALGFDDLRAYLHARCDAGDSIPEIAAELGASDRQVQAALSRSGVRLALRPQRLAAQRRRYTEERIAARVAELGFTDVEAYLVDRVVDQAWLLAEVAAELAAHRLTVRRLLDRYGIRRARRTPRASGVRVGAAGAVGGVAGASGGAAGRTRLRGPGRLPAGAAGRAGLVGEGDAGGASGWAQVAGGGAGPAEAATLTEGPTARLLLGERRAATVLRQGLALGVLARVHRSSGLPNQVLA